MSEIVARRIPEIPPDQEDLINASVLAAQRGDHATARFFASIEADHDEEPCPAVDVPCAGYQLARDYLLGLVSMQGGAAS